MDGWMDGGMDEWVFNENPAQFTLAIGCQTFMAQ